MDLHLDESKKTYAESVQRKLVLGKLNQDEHPYKDEKRKLKFNYVTTRTGYGKKILIPVCSAYGDGIKIKFHPEWDGRGQLNFI